MALSIVQWVHNGPYTGNGQEIVTLPSPPTAGNILVVAWTRRGGEGDPSRVFVEDVFGATRALTPFGASVQFGAPLDASFIAWREVVGDEQTLFFEDGGHITIWEVTGTDATAMAAATVLRAHQQAADDDYPIGTLGVTGDLAFAVWLYGRDFDDTDYYTMGAGWTTDYSDSTDGGSPYTEMGHAGPLAGSIAATSTGAITIAWGGMAVAFGESLCPEADFSAVPRSGGIPLTVDITDLTTGGPTGWDWDFGDGGTSTQQNPTHTYTTEGSFTVTLVVSKSGCPDSTRIRVAYIVTLQDCRPMLFDIYRLPLPGADPFEMTHVATLCEAFDQWFVHEEIGTGSGGLTINRYSEDATEAVLGDGQNDVRLAKIRIPAIATEPIDAVWLETGKFDLLAMGEQGDEDLVFQGRGAVAYIDRGVMAPRAFLTAPYALGDPVDGVWRFERPDYSSSLGFLASAANGTGSLVSSWQLPAVSPGGDDVLLLAFVQIRGPETVTLAAGWTERASQDTSGLPTEIRYILADKIEATAADPYDDTFTSGAAARWTAAQLAFRSTGAPTGEFGTATQSESTPTGTITATLSGSPTAGNVLIVYATETSDGPGVISYVWPTGYTELQRIPGGNNFTGYAAVAYKVADGTETDVDVTISISGGSNLTTSSLLVAEYPILYAPLKAGEILYLVLAELQAAGRPVNPVPLMTLDFTYELDSNGDPWDDTPATAQFTAAVGENVLSVVGRLLGTGALVLVMDPDLTLHAYNRSTYGRDLTGVAFGAGVVRLEAGVNIDSALTRDRDIPRAATHAWATGDEDTYALAVIADAASRIPREVGVRASGTTDAAALAGVGADELTGRLENSERLSVGMGLAPSGGPLFDEAEGYYLPGADGTNGHAWTGDTITLDTGSGEFDYQDDPFRIAAVSIAEPRMKSGAATKVTDFDITLRLGSNMEPGSVPSGGTGGSFGTGFVSSPVGAGSGTVDLSGYQLRSEKGLPDGYASIDTDGYVPVSELGSGAVGDGSRVLADDHTWIAAASGSSMWFNVKDYGALGDGATDDTAAFVAADAAAAAVGGVVYIPASADSYLVSFSGSNIYCLRPSSGTTWQGDGMYASVIELDPGSTVPSRGFGGIAILEIGTPSAGADNITFRDFGILPHWTTKGAAGKYLEGISALEQESNFTEHSDDITIERVRVEDSYIGIGCAKSALDDDAGYTASRHRRWTITGCLIKTTGNKAMDLQMLEDSEVVGNELVSVLDGIQLLNYADRVRVAHNSIEYQNGGINIREGSSDNDIDGNILRCIGGGSSDLVDLPTGIALGTESLTPAVQQYRNVIRNNIITDTASTLKVGLMFTSYTTNSGAASVDILIQSNIFNTETVYMTDPNFPANSEAVRLRVFDNYFAGAVETGAAWVSDRTRFERNHVTDAFTANSDNWDFRGNVFEGGATDASTGSTWGDGALADLTDVSLTAPAEDDDLRYNGSVWVNDPRKWEAVTDGEDVFVWEGDDLVHDWST